MDTRIKEYKERTFWADTEILKTTSYFDTPTAKTPHKTLASPTVISDTVYVPVTGVNKTYINLTEVLPTKMDIYRADIKVMGESSKYYPVYIHGGNQDQLREIKIWRGYSEEVPVDWETNHYEKSLMFTWRGNFGGWGGNQYISTIEATPLVPTSPLADCGPAMSNMSFCFFLRGGGAIYHLSSSQPLNLTGYHTAVSPDIRYNGDTEYIGWDGADTPETAPNKWKAHNPLTAVNIKKLDEMVVPQIADFASGRIKTICSNTLNVIDKTDLRELKATTVTADSITAASGNINGALNVTKESYIKSLYLGDPVYPTIRLNAGGDIRCRDLNVGDMSDSLHPPDIELFRVYANARIYGKLQAKNLEIAEAISSVSLSVSGSTTLKSLTVTGINITV